MVSGGQARIDCGSTGGRPLGARRTNTMSDLQSLMEYPVDFPIKILGPNNPAFVATMTALVLRHAPDFDASTLSSRRSREGKYLSITATIRAVSREQLDALYQDLSDHPMVSAAL